MTKFYIPEKCLKCGKGDLEKTGILFYFKCKKCGAIHDAVSEKNLIYVDPKYRNKLTKEIDL